jgi:hypothetical protein
VIEQFNRLVHLQKAYSNLPQFMTPASATVANSLQKFSASPEEKFGRSGKKFGPPVIFSF